VIGVKACQDEKGLREIPQTRVQRRILQPLNLKKTQVRRRPVRLSCLTESDL
jgi:hypothetical protein